nr:OTU domain-containing protein 4 isoform X5 [Anas platyrhynchos]|eukprot:XP_027311577.1 uncharacterized protein LOC113843443 isoform X2 [Anas platyrhynchos]
MFLRECPRILIEGTRPAPRCLQGGRSAGVRKDSLVGVLGYGCGPACGAQSEEEDECSQEALTVCICSWDDLSCLLAGCVLGLRRPPGTAAPGGVGAGARYPEQRFVCGHPPRPSSKTFPFLSVVPTCRLITPAQPAFPLAAATVGAGRPPLREPACCGLLSPAPGLLAGFVGPCGARRGAASPRGVRR